MNNFEFLNKSTINNGIYKHYGYDERINAVIYILNNQENDLGLPMWLHIYERDKK